MKDLIMNAFYRLADHNYDWLVALRYDYGTVVWYTIGELILIGVLAACAVAWLLYRRQDKKLGRRPFGKRLPGYDDRHYKEALQAQAKQTAEFEQMLMRVKLENELARCLGEPRV